MSYPRASIQSFFEKQQTLSAQNQNTATKPLIDPSDGFTEQDIDTVLHRTLHKWQARVEYVETNINALVPGPGRVQVTGRIANFHHQANSSKMPHAAKGSFRVVVKDNTGAMVVRCLA